MENMKLNILGVEYSIYLDAPDEEMPANTDGFMDYSTKTIKVAAMEVYPNTIKDLDVYKKKVLRHEIIHAFFYESGLWESSNQVEAWGCDEAITDWIAMQAPKLFKAFEEAGCI